jgi:hypothetical protein
LNKGVFFVDIFDLITIVTQLSLPEFLVLDKPVLHFLDVHHQLMDFLVLRKKALVKHFELPLLVSDMCLFGSAELLVEYLIFLHPVNNLVKGFSLGDCVFMFCMHKLDLLFFVLDSLVYVFNVLLLHLDPFLNKVNVLLLDIYGGHLLFSFFVHLVVVLPQHIEIIGDNRLLIKSAGGSNLSHVTFKHEIFFVIIKSDGSAERFIDVGSR